LPALGIVLLEEGEVVMVEIKELDLVEVTEDLPNGIVEGAQGVAVGIQSDTCTVEFIDGQGYTIGLIDIPKGFLEVVNLLPSGESVAREDR